MEASMIAHRLRILSGFHDYAKMNVLPRRPLQSAKAFFDTHASNMSVAVTGSHYICVFAGKCLKEKSRSYKLHRNFWKMVTAKAKSITSISLEGFQQHRLTQFTDGALIAKNIYTFLNLIHFEYTKFSNGIGQRVWTGSVR